MEIANVVAVVTMDRKHPIDAITRKIPGVRYTHKSINAVLRLDSGTAQYSHNGRLLIVGSKSVDAVHKTIDNFVEIMNRHGFPSQPLNDVKICSMTAKAKVPYRVCLARLSELLGTNAFYNPMSKFSGLVYKPENTHFENKVSITIFTTGNWHACGIKHPEQEIPWIVDHIAPVLEQARLL